jgi:glycerophosphoryl diester phosphodiesterase
LQSFDEQNLFHCQEADATVPRAFLVENRPALERGIVSGIADIHMCHGLLDEPTAQRLQAAAISIGVWTVNAEQDIRRVIELGAGVIISDEPALAMELVRG